MQIQITDIQTQEILDQGPVDQIKAIYEEIIEAIDEFVETNEAAKAIYVKVLEAIDQVVETKEAVIFYDSEGNGIKITANEESSK